MFFSFSINSRAGLNVQLSTSFQHEPNLVKFVVENAVLAQIIFDFVAGVYNRGVIAAAELLADRLAVVGLALELERRSPPDDLQVLQTRKGRDKFLRHPVGEILICRVASRINQQRHAARFPRDG